MSKVEVNQISSQCGSTLTIGQSGDTVTLAAGATQSGFGRTGTVDWDTTAKTASFTAVSGNGYFVNTTSGAVTMTLPASPSAGDIVSVKDYAYTFGTNNLTVNRNGSPIGGGTDTDTIVYSTNGDFLTFIYVDGTRGWVLTNDSTNTDETGTKFIVATGGTVTCCGDYKIHTFTGPGTFTVTCAGNAGGSTSLEYLVVAGGGSGGTENSQSVAGGGGGAGGFRFSSPSLAPLCYPAKPLAGSTLTASVTDYPITVGAGGAAVLPAPGRNSGSNSIFSTITSAGGGGGGYTGGSSSVPSPTVNDRSGDAGGSGGGAAHGVTGLPGGAGNTPPVSPPQGNNGGAAAPGTYLGGGGGGATAVGSGGGGSPGPGGAGAGLPTAFGSNGVPCGSFRYYAGGGGGGGSSNRPVTGPAGSGGLGGGATGGTAQGTGNAATANTGGGGGGAGNRYPPGPDLIGGSGGSGIVIIRYKYQ